MGYYPCMHLAALTDPAAGTALLGGAHSLWYEYVCPRFHQALADLDSAVAALPGTASRAIRSELEAGKNGSRAGLADFPGTSSEAGAVRAGTAMVVTERYDS